MNNEADNDSKLVRDAYRASSKEAAPDALNRAVLREATDATTSGRLAVMYAWYRPIAFAAVLVIGVALVFDMQSALKPLDAPAIPARDGFADRAPAASEQEIAPTVPDAKTTFSKPGAVPATIMPDDAAKNSRAATVETRVESAPLRKDRESVRPQSSEALRQLQPAAARSAEMLQSTANMDAASGESPDECTGQYRESPERWWRCVQHLRDAGEAETADEEWQQLKANYPDFVVTD